MADSEGHPLHAPLGPYHDHAREPSSRHPQAVNLVHAVWRNPHGHHCARSLWMRMLASLTVRMWLRKKAPPGGCRAGPLCACWRGDGQSDVTSVMAIRALASSTIALRSA
jgi:hypothetical protein